MAELISFYDWLAKQKNLRTPVGEFARNVTRDAAFPREVATLEAVIEHLRASSKASTQALAVARSAYRAYEREYRPAPRM
jgi:uncharacterized protein YozE (UPF0346 family)